MNSAASLFSQNFGNVQIVMAFALVFFAITLSKVFRLRLEMDFFIASVRTTVQLIAVGFILRWILHADSFAVNILILLVMSLVAAQAVTSRMKVKSKPLFLAAFVALSGSVVLLGSLGLLVFFTPEAFSNTAFFIPFVGVLMGNALSAISLTFVGLERIRTENLLEIETFKALGATSFEACHRLYQDLLRHSLTPILNGMTVVGLVSLPGVMAGQLIGGVDPLTAARFQILVMFLILLTAMVGSLMAVGLNHYYFMPSWLRQTETPWLIKTGAQERIVLSAPSGAGKSRLLKSMAGLDLASLREDFLWSPTAEPVKAHSLSARYLHQRPFFAPGTVEANLQSIFEFQEHKLKAFDPKKVKDLLACFDLPEEILQKNAFTLSGGEAQILHLIRTLLTEPDVLFLDEPTASLDSHRMQRTEEFLIQWVQSNPKRFLIMITHNKQQQLRFATQTLVLKDRQLFYE